MAPSDYKTQRMSRNEARKLISALMADESCLVLTSHGRKRMEQRNVVMVDIVSVLKSSSMRINDEPEHTDGSWRYKCETNRFKIIVSFGIDGETIYIVTVMRKKP